jgi:hypothetical protein
MFVFKKGRLRQDPIIVSPTEVVYRLTHDSSGMSIEVAFNPMDVKDIKPYKVFKEVNDTYVIYKEFSNQKNNKSLKETFEEAIEFFEDNIYEQLKEQKPQVNQPPNNQPPPKTKEIVETPNVNDIVQVGKTYGIVTDVVGGKVIVRNLDEKEAMNILRARKNANISISVANSNRPNDNAIDLSSSTPSTFRKGGVLHKKPTIGDVVYVEGNYGLVTDTYGKKIEVKNLDEQEALRILKENKNGAR